MPNPTEPVHPAAAGGSTSDATRPRSTAAPSWERLARIHGRVLRRMAYEALRAQGACPDRATVEDLIQDVFCRLLERPRSFDWGASRCVRRQRAYLRRVTRSVAVDRRRAAEAIKRGGDVTFLPGIAGTLSDAGESPTPLPADPQPTPEQQVLSRERWRLFLRRCGRVAGQAAGTPRDVQAAVLALVGGWTSRELAAASREGLSPATIDSMVCRVRRRLARSGVVLPRRGAVFE